MADEKLSAYMDLLPPDTQLRIAVATVCFTFRRRFAADRVDR